MPCASRRRGCAVRPAGRSTLRLFWSVRVAAAICVDRQERGRGQCSAVQEVETELGIRVVSILCLDDLVAYLGEETGFEADLQRVRAYLAEYGVSSPR